MFVVHKDGQFFGYYNICPHTGASLDWQPDQFLDLDKALIQCATHDALFVIDTGFCVSGPCQGESLHIITLTIMDDVIYFATP